MLAATHTRLAVVICADLLDEKVPNHLVAAGVNLMLVPAMTKKPGSFETTVEDISGRCQGVSAVVNPRFGADGKPFLCMLGNPRAIRAERLASLTAAAPPASTSRSTTPTRRFRVRSNGDDEAERVPARPRFPRHSGYARGITRSLTCY